MSTEPRPHHLDRTSGHEHINPNLIDVFRYPRLGLRVEAVTSGDPRLQRAREIEVACMAALGDPPEEVIEEFLPYNEHSIFFLAYDDGVENTEENIAGMGRVIPFHPLFPNKTISDLAIIPGWQVEGIEEESAIDIETGYSHTLHKENSVKAAFFEESGCVTLEKVWDIATMAPNFDLVVKADDPKTYGSSIAKAILGAASELGVRTWKEGNLTHVTSFNEKHAHAYFLKKGFPFKPMFGLNPIKYDSFLSDEGMIAQPAWFDLNEFVRQIIAAPNGSYLDMLGENLKASGTLEYSR